MQYDTDGCDNVRIVERATFYDPRRWQNRMLYINHNFYGVTQQVSCLFAYFSPDVVDSKGHKW